MKTKLRHSKLYSFILLFLFSINAFSQKQIFDDSANNSSSVNTFTVVAGATAITIKDLASDVYFVTVSTKKGNVTKKWSV